MHEIYSRYLKKSDFSSLFNFTKKQTASDKTLAKKAERNRGLIFHNPMKQGTYRNKT